MGPWSSGYDVCLTCRRPRDELVSSIKKRFLTPPIENPVDRLIELNELIKKTRSF